MRFSIWPNPERPFAESVEIVRHCESLGWHAAYFADHFMPNGPDAAPLNGDTYEALTTLGALGALTSTIRLGTLVAAATYRHPAVFAKSMATLDRITNGRMIVGMGAGWQENEHAAYGIELGSIKQRIDRFEEYVEIVASMLTEISTDFDGEFYRLRDAPCEPRPVQTPPPILLGVKGAKRTMALAAAFADIWNAWTSPSDLRSLNAVLDGHCADLGRDPGEIERSTQAMVFVSNDESWLSRFRDSPTTRAAVVGTPGEVLDTMAQYVEAGCDEFIVPSWNLGELSRAVDTISLLDADVVRPLH